MFFRITFRTFVKQATAWFWRQPLILRLLFSMIKPLQELNDDGVAVRAFGQTNPSLYQLWRFLNEFVAFDARTIYLQKWLNIFYDPVLERIEIANNNNLPIQFLFNKAENAVEFFMFNNWDSTKSYISSPEDYVQHVGTIWTATANSTNKTPVTGSAFWQDFDDVEYFFNKNDTLPPSFTVRVPIAVEMNPEYSTERITAQINIFNAAGRDFDIQIF